MEQKTQVKKSIFLSAKWQNLVMINYEVNPAILEPHLPPFTALDTFEGKALVSMVGFMFNDTKVFGLKWPFHTHFEEVNLRFYVKHFDGKNWKRGVSFISEIVPKPIISITANMLYNEHYSTARMNHNIETTGKKILVEYNWKSRNSPWSKIKIQAANSLQDIEPNSEAEFIFEHYFGYNKLSKNATIEYAVEHPRWQMYPVTDFLFEADIAGFYGKEFAPFIDGVAPHSVFLAKGSNVIVRKPVKITSGDLP